MTEKRFVRKGSKIWDTWEDEEVYELYYRYEVNDICRILNDWSEKNEQLKSENKRLTDELNKTALELVDECISQGKATEISEMSYNEFLDYRAKNGKPMELQE